MSPSSRLELGRCWGLSGIQQGRHRLWDAPGPRFKRMLRGTYERTQCLIEMRQKGMILIASRRSNEVALSQPVPIQLVCYERKQWLRFVIAFLAGGHVSLQNRWLTNVIARPAAFLGLLYLANIAWEPFSARFRVEISRKSRVWRFVCLQTTRGSVRMDRRKLDQYVYGRSSKWRSIPIR